MPDANLNFQITGDASQFQAALKQAQAASRQTADGMQSAFVRASEKAAGAVRDLGRGIGSTFEQVAKNIGQAATQWGDQWAGVTQGAFNSVSSAARGMISSVAGIFGGGVARMTDLALNLFALPFENALDQVTRRVARFMRENPMLFSARPPVPLGLPPPPVLFDLPDWLRRQGYTELADAISATPPPTTATTTDAQPPPGVRQPNREHGRLFGPAIADLDKQADIEGRLADTIGRSAGAIARARAELELWRALWMQGDRVPSAEQLAEMNRVLDRIEEGGDSRQERQDRQQITAQIQREIEMEGERAAAINLTAGARARERAEAMIRGFNRGRGGRGAAFLETEEGRALVARREASADAAARTQFTNEQTRTVEEQTAAYRLQTDVLGANAGAAARLTFIQQELNKARRAGITLTEADRVVMEANAAMLERQAQQVTMAREAFQRLQEWGRVTASSLEGAFAKFMDGTKQSWRSFVNDLSKDMAKLAFRQLFINTLFGQGPGSSNPLGLFGQVFGGFRAEGGPVSAGKTYMVGEHGPELFRTRQSGMITPNSALRGGNPSVINMRIDLAGANGDETIARISGQAARMAAMAAVAESNAAFPARQRRLQMLGA